MKPFDREKKMSEQIIACDGSTGTALLTGSEGVGYIVSWRVITPKDVQMHIWVRPVAELHWMYDALLSSIAKSKFGKKDVNDALDMPDIVWTHVHQHIWESALLSAKSGDISFFTEIHRKHKASR